MGPIGVFDSGFGGLTVLESLVKVLPEYDFLYLGDNARTPYGTRDFDTVLEFTWQAVEYLFQQNCSLVILACNTASAKALRTIQQKRLHQYPGKNVLGVIRPTTESIGKISSSKNIGILATNGTVNSETYPFEIHKFFPDVKVYQQACPLWVPLIENNEFESTGGRYFVEKYLEELLYQNPAIDTVILGCTHYPILIPQLVSLRPDVHFVNQGEIVAAKLKEYLDNHPEYEALCSKKGTVQFLTTDNPEKFNETGSIFYRNEVLSSRVRL